MNINFNFWLIVLIASLGTIFLCDKILFEKKRNGKIKKKKEELINKTPFLAKMAKNLIGTVTLVFLIRELVIGNYFIPSSSMSPTLRAGDFVVTNQSSLFLTNPFNGDHLITIKNPKRGDVIIFRYPVNEKIKFIKRIIGIPKDVISYHNKKLEINGIKAKYKNCYYDKKNIKICTEVFNSYSHKIKVFRNLESVNFEELTVPKDMYFVMGDNRDNSEDSRYWGLVDSKNIISKAEFVWLSWDSDENTICWKQIGKIL